MLRRALLVCPDEVPAELGGDYAAACQTLGLSPIPRGYALYLLRDGIAGQVTLISRDVDQLRTAQRRRATGAPPGSQHPDLVGVVGDGWPVELGGGPRCQFCRALDPAWVYDGPTSPCWSRPSRYSASTTRSVGSNRTAGSTGLPASRAGRLIDAGDYPGLLRRYGKRLLPMPVQTAWQTF